MKPIIISQYKASLAMLQDAVEKCTEPLWIDPRHKPPFWRIAYHTLFYTDLYLSERLESFSPWASHIDEYQSIEPMVHKGGRMPKDGPPYSKQELLDYLALIVGKIDERVHALDLESGSGFSWLPFTKLELQFYNIRHVHHHAGQLSIWLREELGEETEWVRSGQP